MTNGRNEMIAFDNCYEMHTRHKRHGGAYDRGSADAYYGREFDPHYFVGATYESERVGQSRMTKEEVDAYAAGYYTTTDRKDWGSWE